MARRIHLVDRVISYLISTAELAFTTFLAAIGLPRCDGVVAPTRTVAQETFTVGYDLAKNVLRCIGRSVLPNEAMWGPTPKVQPHQIMKSFTETLQKFETPA